MKKIKKSTICNLFLVIFAVIIGLSVSVVGGKNVASADTNDYYTIFDTNEDGKVLFMKGDNVNVDDEYISSDNRLYVIKSVDDTNKTGVAEYM